MRLLRAAGNCLLVVAKGIQAVVSARGQLLEPGGVWVIEVRGQLLRAREQLLRVRGVRDEFWGLVGHC